MVAMLEVINERVSSPAEQGILAARAPFVIWTSLAMGAGSRRSKHIMIIYIQKECAKQCRMSSHKFEVSHPSIMA